MSLKANQTWNKAAQAKGARKGAQQQNLQQVQDCRAREIYYCECGRQYKSFPATYLHFRTKHRIKLSTKPTELRKVVVEEGNLKKITYLIRQNERQLLNSPAQTKNSGKNGPSRTQNEGSFCSEQNSPDSIGFLSECIEKYLNSSQIVPKALYKSLLQFVDEKFSLGAQTDSHTIVDAMVYKINQFVLDHLPSWDPKLNIGSAKWKVMCQEILSFCRWLKKEKYTELTVVYDLL